METLVLERNGSIYLTNAARVVRDSVDVPQEVASRWDPGQANPFITWIAGNFVEADNPNSNRQFWTRGDLEMSSYSIRFSPLNMVHRFRRPVGFIADTRNVDLVRANREEANQGSMRIEALSGMWSHIFPFESALVSQADERGSLFYSMECRGTHLVCAGDEGCGNKFEYMDFESHCEHLKERASVRHIVNPTFRGGALIIPPVRPGWTGANASIQKEALQSEVASFAEETEAIYESSKLDGSDLSVTEWESLMASILAVADSE